MLLGSMYSKIFPSVLHPKSDLHLRFYDMTSISPVVIGESRRRTFLEFLGKEQTYRQCAHAFLGHQCNLWLFMWVRNQ